MTASRKKSPARKPSRKKRCFYFGTRKTDGSAKQKMLLGGKGANLADMTSIGLPVPPGFTITTETCADYTKSNRLPAGLMDEVKRNVVLLEKEQGHLLSLFCRKNAFHRPTFSKHDSCIFC